MNLKTLITSLFKIAAFTLVIAVLFPSVVKLSHAFNHHKHQVCSDDVQHSTHFHQSDLDCDFYKFKQTNTYYFDAFTCNSQSQSKVQHLVIAYYSFLNSHQQLTSYLRGPPDLV